MPRYNIQVDHIYEFGLAQSKLIVVEPEQDGDRR